MRSAAMILALLLVLGSLFAFVVLRDRPDVHVGDRTAATTPTTRKSVPTTIPTLDPTASVIGGTQGVAVQSLNAKGELASEFNVDRLEPRKDGAVDVFGPIANFYGKSGGIVSITGASGTVMYSQVGGKDDPSAVGSATPTSGTLRDVTIRLYDAVGDAEPSLVARVPAVRFDALDNRVQTVDDVRDGKQMLAENVPVSVRGREYEFDGYGLVMRWNDRDSRLEQLDIHRGERLLVKDVGKFNGNATPAEEKADKPVEAAKPAAHRAEPATRPAADRKNAPKPAAPTPQPRPARQELYRVTFDRDVRVNRAGVEVARADVMNVVLALDSKRRDDPTTRPADAPAPNAEPKPQRAESRPRRDPPAPKPATAPATTRAAEPVEIRWAGTLTVRPVDADPARPAGKMVELVGAPARVAQSGGSIEGRLIHVEPDSGRARIEPGGPVKAIELLGADGGRLRSRSPLVIDRAAGLATINGGGALTAPAAKPDENSGNARAAANVTWSRRLELRLGNAGVESRDASPWLSEVTIEGDARIESDQLGMTGDALVLAFDPPAVDAPRPEPTLDGSAALPAPEARQLRLVTARGRARVEAGPVDQRRSLAGEELRLGFVASDDGPALTTVNGNGDVSLIDADGTEFAGQTLEVGMKPTALLAATTQPAPYSQPTGPEDALALIERLDARGAVSLKRRDGTTAYGDRVELAGTEADRRLVLTGAPARAGGATGVVTATRLELDPKTRDVRVPVAGQLTSGDANDPAASTGTVLWDRAMSLDATAGKVDVEGNVRIESLDPKGSTLHAKARAATLTFAPDVLEAASRPTTNLAMTRPTTRPSPAASVRAMVLRDDVDVTFASADGRYANVQTRLLNLDVEHDLLTADEPGRMMMHEKQRAATQPTTAPGADPTTSPDATVAATPEPSTRPAARPRATELAIGWNGKLRWELKTGRLAITDRVVIGYDRNGRGDRIRIYTDRLFGTLSPIDVRAPRTNDPATPPVELRAIRAEGNVLVRSRLAEFDAASLDFDLASNLAYARGDAQRDVVVNDSRGASGVSFSAITWNVETGAIEDFRDIRGRLRQ